MLKENGFRHCPRCASQNLQFSSKNICCAACSYTFYQNIAAAVGAIIYRQSSRGKEVLLTVRAHDPKRGCYDLPGGFIDPGENLEEGLRRELQEELGPDLEPNLGPLSYLCSGNNIYHYKQVKYLVCDAFFSAELSKDVPIHAADDVASYVWCPALELDFQYLAFDSTRKALGIWLA